jgi:putative flavoprotein involved in K+ transport
MSTERFDTVIIGGGQAGLTTGYYLAKQGRSFVILDANPRIGDAWRNRWDSLRLFTPARYDGLPGWPFPAPAWSFPTKDEMADYLEAYAAKFGIPVRNGVSVEAVTRNGKGFIVTAGDDRFVSDNIVVASGAHRVKRTPSFAATLDPRILQIHSSDYRNPSQLPAGDVLIVGVGNSGAEIANELAQTHHVLISGKEKGQVPVEHGSRASKFVFPIIRFLGHRVLTKRTAFQRKLAMKAEHKGTPLIRVKRKHLDAAGVEWVARTIGVRDGKPELEDGSALNVTSVIWCTGFRQDYDWIDVPVFGEDGLPIHDRGVVDAAPGLYFMGLLFQFSESSDVLPSKGRDARHVAKHIASRSRKASEQPVAAGATR